MVQTVYSVQITEPSEAQLENIFYYLNPYSSIHEVG